jgi:hypothetical protein
MALLFVAQVIHSSRQWAERLRKVDLLWLTSRLKMHPPFGLTSIMRFYAGLKVRSLGTCRLVLSGRWYRLSSTQETPRIISVTFAILGPIVLLINTGLIARPSGEYPPADYGDMAIAALLTLAGWAQVGPPFTRWVMRQLNMETD